MKVIMSGCFVQGRGDHLYPEHFIKLRFFHHLRGFQNNVEVASREGDQVGESLALEAMPFD